MSLEDPDHGSVTLDRAEDGGLLGWPDIVGRYVSIGWRGMPEEGLIPPQWKVLQVGPIGLLVERVARRGGDVFRNEPGPATFETLRMVVPWSMAIIAWVERSEPVQEPTDGDH